MLMLRRSNQKRHRFLDYCSRFRRRGLSKLLEANVAVLPTSLVGQCHSETVLVSMETSSQRRRRESGLHWRLRLADVLATDDGLFSWTFPSIFCSSVLLWQLVASHSLCVRVCVLISERVPGLEIIPSLSSDVASLSVPEALRRRRLLIG